MQFKLSFIGVICVIAVATLPIATSVSANPSSAYKAPVTSTPPTGRVAVSQALTMLDASGSQENVFADGKATLESLVTAMPRGDYQAGLLEFGGFSRESTGMADFDRENLGRFAHEVTFLTGTTPLFDVLESDVAPSIGKGSGQAAVVLISDGIATDFGGHGGADASTVAAAKAIAESRAGKTCFHTIQSGSSPGGANLLQQIARVTNCGSFRNASSLTTASALQEFSREVYLGGAPAAPAPAPAPVTVESDADADGVADGVDRCPNTLKLARVDSRGCWTLSDLRFAVNGAAIEIGFSAGLGEDLAVLKANPETRIRIDGHTDSDGSAAYNEALSTRRAESVRDFFVSKGDLDADRFEVKGFGESAPIAPNDSTSNKRLNRRVELTILE